MRRRWQASRRSSTSPFRTTDADLVWRSNLEGTRNLIAAAKEHAPQARLIMTSTGVVYDADLAHPAREDDSTAPTAPYPASKVEAERELRDSGLTWTVLRLAFVYGDGDGHLQAAPELFSRSDRHPAQTVSTVHERDIATAVELALTGVMDGRVVNIVDEAPLTVHEIASIVGAPYGDSAAPLANPWAGHMDGSLARELGFRPIVASVYQAEREGIL